MDYLDRGKALRHHIILLVGYLLIAVAIAIASLILLYQAYGFGINRSGKVIQNGLVFFSSQPNPADIYTNGQLQSAKTNTRLALPADIYQIKLVRNGYHDWKRPISLLGGSVQHFDYPLLIPRELVTKKPPAFPAYTSQPGLMTQSPDHRWVVIQKPGGLGEFDLYDLEDPEQAPIALTLPDALLTKPTGTLVAQEWASDNRHLLLQHVYDGKTEFILLDREDTAQSVNLNTTLAATPTKLTLLDKKYDRYYLYNEASQSLQTASLKEPAPVTRLERVFAYKSYGDNTILYVTPEGAPEGKVNLRLLTGDNAVTIRGLPANTTYLVDLAKYANVMYVVGGASSDGRVYVYRDPAAQLRSQPTQAPVPQHVLKLTQPNYVSFSSTVQYVMAQNGTQFTVYDILKKEAYSYAGPALDPPQAQAHWMDGDRLAYVSGGKLSIADYDNRNRHLLMATSAAHLPAYATADHFIYTLGISEAGQYELQQTALLTVADQ